jgi:type I restriction enzyme, S subunit
MARDWRPMSFADLIGGRENIVCGPFGSNLTQSDYTTSGVPVIRGGNMGQRGRFTGGDFAFVSTNKAARLSSNQISAGDIVVTQRGTMGQVSIVSPKPATRYVVSQSQMGVRVENSDPLFVYYLLRSPAFSQFLQGATIQTGVPHINMGLLRDWRVTAPCFFEQTRISGVLGSFDDKIELNRAINDTFEASARALFQSWFVDFDPVRAKTGGGEPCVPAEIAACFPDSFEGSKLGMVPKGWEVGSLGDVLTTMECGSRPKGGVSIYRSGVPSVGAESIVGIGLFDYAKTKFVPRVFFESMRRGICQPWDVLLYKDGGTPGKYEPHVTMVGEGFPFDEFCINEHVYRLRADATLGQTYLYLCLSSDATMEELRRKGTGVAIPGLNSTALSSVTILKPPRAIIENFEHIVRLFLKDILIRASESRTLAELRNALLPKLFSGEISVLDAERTTEKSA